MGLLPRNILPRKYTLHITPNLKTFTFTGKLSVNLQVKESSDSLTFNTAKIENQKLILSQNNKTLFQWTKDSSPNTQIHQDCANETLKITSPLAKGPALLQIDYSAEINDEMRGFYRAMYRDAQGNKNFIGVTQFEAVDARRAFPCWDEPDFKARYQISITVPSDLNAISNTPSQSVEFINNGALKTVHFEETPIMSSYLVAWVIGKLDRISLQNNTTTISVYAPPHSIGSASFALKCAKEFLQYFEEYFAEKYPIAKLDMVAIPDFASGAMENWGLVTYRDTSILAKSTDAQRTLERAAIVVAHELSHQWFGNLITMQWWSHLWLNEGFASFMEIVATKKVFENWDIQDEFFSDQMEFALYLDAFDSSHPIEVNVAHPREIDSIFDAISYDKGALVVRMIHNFIGQKNFMEGIRQYIQKYKYANASTQNLWECLEQSSQQKVGQIMQKFTQEKGFPLVQVEKKIDGIKLRISQAKFVSSTSNEKDCHVCWTIPLCTLDQKRFLLDSKLMEIDFSEDAEESGNFIVNAGANGYFRTLYSKDLIEKILPKLHTLKRMDRYIFLSDYCAATLVGNYKTVGDLFPILQTYKTEKSFIVLRKVCQCLSAIYSLIKSKMDNAETEERYKEFAYNILLPHYGEGIDWSQLNGKSIEEKKIAVQLFTTLAALEYPAVLCEGNVKFKQFMDENVPIDKDFERIVFKIGARDGGKKEWKFFLDLVESENSPPARKISALLALGAFKDGDLIKASLEEILEKESIRPQDVGYCVAAISGYSSEGAILVWEWLQSHYEAISKKFKNDKLFSDFIIAQKNFSSFERAAEVEEFFKDKKDRGFAKDLKETLEKIRISAMFLQNNMAILKQWLEEENSVIQEKK